MKKQPKVKPYVARDRLNALADFLDSLPRKKFDFSIYASGRLDKCGTTGCALGWATTMPRFKRMGLELSPSPHKHSELKVILKKDNKKIAQCHKVAQYIFGLTENESVGLFMPEYGYGFDWSSDILDDYATPKQVAKNIRKFIKWKWPARVTKSRP